MGIVFSFFLRLFLCFAGAKLVLRAVDLDSREYLLALTLVLLINTYLFYYLVYRDRRPRPAGPPEKPASEPPAPEGS